MWHIEACGCGVEVVGNDRRGFGLWIACVVEVLTHAEVLDIGSELHLHGVGDDVVGEVCSFVLLLRHGGGAPCEGIVDAVDESAIPQGGYLVDA